MRKPGLMSGPGFSKGNRHQQPGLGFFGALRELPVEPCDVPLFRGHLKDGLFRRVARLKGGDQAHPHGAVLRVCCLEQREKRVALFKMSHGDSFCRKANVPE